MQVRFPEDERFPAWKIAFLQYTIAATLLMLLVGYWRLQIAENRFFIEQAERNRVRNLPVIAPRGRILDREGRVLVDNAPAFTVLLMRETAGKLVRSRLEQIARGVRLDPTEVSRLLERSVRLPRFQPLVLKQLAPLEDIAFVEAHRLEYPELALINGQQRVYPHHKVGAAAIGYVGQVSEEMLAKPNSPYRPGDVVGQSGIERSYNAALSGRDGMRRVIVNSRGQEVGSLNTIDALPGNDLHLTLDLDLQMAAEASLGDRAGAVVALDPRTGEVLAMASHPTFDPNDFAHQIDPTVWHQLISDPFKPMLNKAIQAQLAPGSVFKVITATAALETGTIKPGYTVYCPGVINLYGHDYHDYVWGKQGGHGMVDFHRALVVSCDIYFYTLGKLLGIERIDYFAKRLGLGMRTGIDLPSEASGLIPSPEWVQKAFKRQWWAGETISVAIGQGSVEVTPLQLAYTVGGIVLGGAFHRPHLAFRNQLLALGIDPPEDDDRRFPLRETTVAAVSRGLWGVVNEDGTGVAARSPGLEIAGKTGTAQVVSVELKESARKREFKNNAWFVGYSPSAKPEIAVSVLVMQGEHSAVAVPIARDVIKAYYDKKLSRKANLPQTETQVRLMTQLTDFASTPRVSAAKKGP